MKITGKDKIAMYSHILNLKDEYKKYRNYCNLNEFRNKKIRENSYQIWADDVRKTIVESNSSDLENFKRYVIQRKRNNQALNPVPGTVICGFFGGFGVSFLTMENINTDDELFIIVNSLMIGLAIAITIICCISAVKTSRKNGFYDDFIEILQEIIDESKLAKENEKKE